MSDYMPTEIQIKLREDEKLKAIVTLKFGKLVVRGFRIQTSDKTESGYWVTPPSIPIKGRVNWYPIFFMEDKDTWRIIEQKILEALDKKLSEHITVDDLDNMFGDNI